MRITKVYTRVGDGGSTRLAGGQSVPKDNPRIEAYGTVDETNAIVGMVRTALRDVPELSSALDEVLKAIQNDLFNVGGELAVRVEDRWEGIHLVGQDEVTRLEAWCDRFNGELEPLREFVLPGGAWITALLHQARTVCRRAERRVVTLARDQPEVGTGCLIYMNRLSDLFFVLGRWSAFKLGETEVLWDKPG